MCARRTWLTHTEQSHALQGDLNDGAPACSRWRLHKTGAPAREWEGDHPKEDRAERDA